MPIPAKCLKIPVWYSKQQHIAVVLQWDLFLLSKINLLRVVFSKLIPLPFKLNGVTGWLIPIVAIPTVSYW